MSEVDNLFADVRQHLRSLGLHRDAASISQPLPVSPSTPVSPPASTFRFDEANGSHQSPPQIRYNCIHEGDFTDPCQTCAIVARSKYEESQKHISSRIEATRQEIDAIDSELALRRAVLGFTEALYDFMADLTPESPESISLLTSPSPELNECPMSMSGRRQTICALPVTPESDISLEVRPHTANVPASSRFSAQATPPSYDYDLSSAIQPAFILPARSTSLVSAPGARPAAAARLSKPFEEKWAGGVSDECSADEYEQAVVGRRYTRYHGQSTSSFFPSQHTQRCREKRLPAPPLQRTYTPRTESTTELLGTLGSELLVHEGRGNASANYYGSFMSNREAFVTSPTSEMSDGHEVRSHEHGWKWHTQRGVRKGFKQKRRHSKADELLGFHTPQSPTMAENVISSAETLQNQSAGRRGKFSLLKLSKLRIPSGRGST